MPREKLGNFVFLKVGSVVKTFFYSYLVNTFRRKFRTGDEKNVSQMHLLMLYVYQTRCLFSVC